MQTVTHDSARVEGRKGQQFGMRWYCGLFLLPLVAVLAARPGQQPIPPSYGGRNINEWLDAGYEDSAMALQHIGPAAGPYVLAKLSREDSHFGLTAKRQRLWSRLPTALRRIVPRPQTGNFDELRATSALLELGPPVIPLTAVGLRDRNPAVRCACARTLLTLRRQGADIRVAVPGLRVAMLDSNPEVAKYAAAALEQTIHRVAQNSTIQ